MDHWDREQLGLTLQFHTQARLDYQNQYVDKGTNHSNDKEVMVIADTEDNKGSHNNNL